MTVGDDWQSINRFAGADISVMTDFEGWFGEGLTLPLSTTFRCTQTVAETAAAARRATVTPLNRPRRRISV